MSLLLDATVAFAFVVSVLAVVAVVGFLVWPELRRR